MCGRFTQWASQVDLETLFQVMRVMGEFPAPRYNVAPTNIMPVITSVQDARVMDFKRWGLIPSWSRDHKIGYRTINARAETLASKPAFRSAFRHRRCLVPATGYYEWKKLDAKTKQPFHIQMQDAQPFAFAGLWETWAGPKESPFDNVMHTFTIITTDANDLTAAVHDRMPVIIHPPDFDQWLDPGNSQVEQIKELLVPFESEAMTMNAVSTYVNKVGNEGPACLDPPT